MALAEERSAGMAELQSRLDELAATFAAKDAENQMLLAKNAALARALEERPQQGKAQSAGASLVQSGVQVPQQLTALMQFVCISPLLFFLFLCEFQQMIPSSDLDLDLTNKELLGTGVYSGECTNLCLARDHTPD